MTAELPILERMLLQAGTWEPSRALGAWREFCRQVDDVEALHNRCYGLFPMVAQNLEGCASTLKHGDYLQSTLKHSWAQSKRMLSCVLPVLAAFQNENIEFLVLKGLGLSPHYYRHWGSRPLKDMAILIRANDVDRASQILRRMEWIPQRGVLPEESKKPFLLESETVWEHPSKAGLQLQWRLAWGCCDVRVEAGAWARAVPCPLPGFEARTLGATEHFFLTCVQPVDDTVSQWADAAMLVRGGEIDWGRLNELARQFEQVEPVRETIQQLGQLDLGIPSSVLDRWRESKASALEELEKSCRAQPMVRRWKIKHTALTILRLNQGASLGVLWRNSVAYLKQIDDLHGVLRRAAVMGYVICWSRGRNR